MTGQRLKDKLKRQRRERHTMDELKWTPVSKGLPKHGQEILIAVKWRRNSKKFEYFHAWYIKDDNDAWYDTEGTKAIDVRVVKAWMPVPEYKEDR